MLAPVYEGHQPGAQQVYQHYEGSNLLQPKLPCLNKLIYAYGYRMQNGAKIVVGRRLDSDRSISMTGWPKGERGVNTREKSPEASAHRSLRRT